MKITILKYPTETDLLWCKTCTLNTVGKKSTKKPTQEWLEQIVKSEHSPIKTKYDRNEAPQGQIVSHIMSVNAQELIFMSHKRLCKQASPETREVMKEICKQVIAVAPYMKDVLVPLCKYRNGKCDEMFSYREKING